MYDVIIIGAGCSGLFARKLLKNYNVLTLEKMKTSGNKLLLTGNGRCNITNLKQKKDLISMFEHNSKFLYSTINKFDAYDIYKLINEEVELVVEKNDCVFPKSNKSSDILNFLLSDCNTEINYNAEVTKVQKEDDYYIITTPFDTYKSKNVIVATGGVSFPHTGSTGSAIDFAKFFNIKVVDLFPCEAPIILKDNFNLAGTSFSNVEVSFDKKIIDGHLIFTHTGLSGSAIMKASEYIYKKKIKEIEINFYTKKSFEDFCNLLEKYREKQISTTLAQIFTIKFSEYLLNKLSIDKSRLTKQLIHKEVLAIFDLITKHKFIIDKVENIEKAFVTGGGISTKSLNPKSFENKENQGLYFIGECVDIHGPIGGYNLTLALSSAYSAYSDIITKF